MRIVSVNPRAERRVEFSTVNSDDALGPHLMIDGSHVMLTRPEEYRDLWLWVNHVARHNKSVRLCIREG